LHGQVLGVITSTIGVAIAFKKFDALDNETTHTKLGVAIMVLVWIQVLLSVIRPKRLADQLMTLHACVALTVKSASKPTVYALVVNDC
jgi:cytochrome b561